MDFYIEDYLPLFMFGALAVLLFSGYPVAFVLGGIGLTFGFIGMAFGDFYFSFIQFFNLLPRLWGEGGGGGGGGRPVSSRTFS